MISEAAMTDSMIHGWAIPDSLTQDSGTRIVFEAPGGRHAVLYRNVEEKAPGHFICDFSVLENKESPAVLFSPEPFLCYDDPRGNPFYFSREGRYLITKIIVNSRLPGSQQNIFLFPLYLIDLWEKKSAYHTLFSNAHISIFEKSPGCFQLGRLRTDDKAASAVDVARLKWFERPRPQYYRREFWQSL